MEISFYCYKTMLEIFQIYAVFLCFVQSPQDLGSCSPLDKVIVHIQHHCLVHLCRGIFGTCASNRPICFRALIIASKLRANTSHYCKVTSATEMSRNPFVWEAVGAVICAGTCRRSPRGRNKADLLIKTWIVMWLWQWQLLAQMGKAGTAQNKEIKLQIVRGLCMKS